jgi:shikimate kinase
MALSNHNATWTLTHAEYQELQASHRKLRALEAAGVDNWGGYDDAIQSLDEEN